MHRKFNTDKNDWSFPSKLPNFLYGHKNSFKQILFQPINSEKATQLAEPTATETIVETSTVVSDLNDSNDSIVTNINIPITAFPASKSGDAAVSIQVTAVRNCDLFYAQLINNHGQLARLEQLVCQLTQWIVRRVCYLGNFYHK